MRSKYFRLSPPEHVSLGERILHRLIWFGIPTFGLKFVFSGIPLFWQISVPVMLLGSALFATVFATLEHLVFRLSSTADELARGESSPVSDDTVRGAEVQDSQSDRRDDEVDDS